MNNADHLTDMLKEVYAVLDERQIVGVAPSHLAAEVYAKIDPGESAPLLVRHGCIMHLRQLARAICRSRLEASEVEDQQEVLFEQLQSRYPTDRGPKDDPVYVLREHLTLKERRDNEARLRRVGFAFLAHADALGAETDERIAAGVLQEDLVGV